MKVYYKATQGDPTKGCYYTSNFHLLQKLKSGGLLTDNCEEADMIYISENCGGLELFEKHPDKIKVLQLVCSHPALYCKLMEEECTKFDMWDERPFIWAPTRQKEIDLADYIIVYSDFSKKACIDNGVPAEKVIVIPKGVETDVFFPKEKDHKEFTILVPGQQFIMKGIQYIMEAYKELKEEEFKFKIILCGDRTTHMAKDGKTRTNEIARLIPNDIEIINYGRVSRGDLIKLYTQCDVVLCPSIEDSFNMTVLEALSCDKPVICTENTGAGELLEHHKNGSIIPIRDVAAIKEEIKYWKDNAPKGCRELALEHTMDKYMSDVINFLKGLKTEETKMPEEKEKITPPSTTVEGLTPGVTVILLSWKRPDNIKVMVDSLMKQTIKPKLFLWNNNPEVKIKNKEIEWIVNSTQNVGAYARWLLVPMVTTEYLMVLDDDVGILPDNETFMEQAINLVKEHPDGIIGAFGKRIEPGDRPYNGPEIRTDHADIVKAKCMCMRTEILKNVPLGTVGRVREDDIYISYYAANGKKNAHFISWALRQSTVVLPEGDCGNDKNPKHMNSRNDFINKLVRENGMLK